MSVKVTLEFENQAERDEFMGQLSDGWGENFVSLTWDELRWHNEETHDYTEKQDFDQVREFKVELLDTETWRKTGWHLDIWDGDGWVMQVTPYFKTRHEAVDASMIHSRTVRIHEDWEDE